MKTRILLCIAAFAFMALGGLGISDAQTPDDSSDVIKFNRDIRPILSDKCFACHGLDENKRKAKLRLDIPEGAYADRGGYAAVKPNDAAHSELIKRINHADPDERMPHKDSGKSLSKDEIATLTRWIAQGAPYEGHWAFIAPRRPEAPKVKDASWALNPIDGFVLRKLDYKGLKPSPPADRRTMIRRVTFDLTGLPPRPEDVEAFVNDTDPLCYEKLVDRLLASSAYGEHMARFWLDAARYADTHGLHFDNYREIWSYRDFVVRAFNQNMPWNQFVTWNLAGDLLPDPTVEQLVASGFNRLNLTTNEGGSIQEEVLVRNVVDRTDAFGTAFMGLTVGCAGCHDHKFDPITQKEFYSMFAYFNSLDGSPMDGNKKDDPPVIKVTTPEQKEAMSKFDAQVLEIETRIVAELAKVQYVEPVEEKAVVPPPATDILWIDDAPPQGAKLEGEGDPWQWVNKDKHPVHTGERSIRREAPANALHQNFFTGAQPLEIHAGDVLFAHVYIDEKNPPKSIQLQFNNGKWEHRARWGAPAHAPNLSGGANFAVSDSIPDVGKWVRLEVSIEKVDLKPGDKLNGWAFTQVGGTVYYDAAGIRTNHPADDRASRSLLVWEQRAGDDQSVPAPVRQAIKIAPDQRHADQTKLIHDHYFRYVFADTKKTFASLENQINGFVAERKKIESQSPISLIMREKGVPEPAFILKRGEYDQRGEQVTRAVPAALPPMPENAPANRLGLAQWLTGDKHPLMSRVTVNRFWQQCFGIGIVKTAEDFGSQGEWPSHPDLLDYLAVDFQESGWDVKRIMRMIVTSATYQQSSNITPELLKRDPENRLLARGPRYRLDAEMLRDQALSVSGLLVTKLGGPPVRPPQPAGLWEAVGFTSSDTAKFKADEGPDKVYRRSLYTFWKRTSPPPQMTTFDAPSREACVIRRERTNTPLQALLLLNETQYVEAARSLAMRVLREAPGTPEQRIDRMVLWCAARHAAPAETKELLSLYHDLKSHYQADESAALKLLNIKDVKPDASFTPAEGAAWTMIANTLLNLDETITKN